MGGGVLMLVLGTSPCIKVTVLREISVTRIVYIRRRCLLYSARVNPAGESSHVQRYGDQIIEKCTKYSRG